MVVDVVTEFAREGAISELLYADELILMSETIEGLRNKFLTWKGAFESKGFKVNLVKSKEMVSDSISMDGTSKSKVDPCGVCNLRAKANSDLFQRCGKWINGRLTTSTTTAKRKGMASNTIWKSSMMPERTNDGNFAKDKKINGDSNV